MNRLLPITAMLLLTVAFAMAKSSTTASHMSTVAATNTNQRTVQGCLSGAKGNYTLTDSVGNIWQLEGDTGQLKNDVGNTVALTGMGNNAAALTGNSKDYIDVDMTSIDDFLVSSVKKVSEGCSAQKTRYARIKENETVADE